MDDSLLDSLSRVVASRESRAARAYAAAELKQPVGTFEADICGNFIIRFAIGGRLELV